MFRCADKCAGIIAAKARLLREETCYMTAIKEKDEIAARRAKLKMQETSIYIKYIEEWPPAAKLALKPAVAVSRIRPAPKRDAIMKQIENVLETNTNPITGRILVEGRVTLQIVKYLIAKHDKKPFVREKRFLLTRENINILKYLMSICQDNAKAACFLQSLMGVA